MTANGAAYPLAHTPTEAGRLALQARAWRPAAERLFDEIGVGPGWRCIDLGCGPIGVLQPLSLRVGPAGSVTGLDINPEFVAVDAGGGNISRIRGDVLAPPRDLGQFDLTHARFLFAPLSSNTSLLETMWSLTRQGGVLAVQEPDACSWKLFPGSPCFQDLISAIVAGFEAAGSDFNAGQRLPDLIAALRGAEVSVRAEVLTLAWENPYLRMPVIMAQNLKSRILDHGIMSERGFEYLLAECNRLLTSPPRRCGLSFTLVQAWARKRHP